MKKINIYYSALMAMSLVHFASAEVKFEEWDFENGSHPIKEFNQVEATVDDGVLTVNAVGNDPYMVLPESTLTPPLRLKFKMKAGPETSGQLEVYWSNPELPFSGTRVLRTGFKNDNQWHEYDLSVPIFEGPATVRLDTGWSEGVYELDYIRLEEDPMPEDAYEGMKELPEEVSISNNRFDLKLQTSNHFYTLKDSETGRTWVAGGTPLNAAMTKAQVIDDKLIEMNLLDWATRTNYTATVSLDKPDGLSFTLDADNYDVAFDTLQAFPPAFKTELDDGHLIFCDRSSGLYIDQYDSYYGGKPMWMYGNTHCIDMPWVGTLDETTGQGVMMYVDTPYDTWVWMDNEDQGKIWPKIVWQPSMDTFRYARSLSYLFTTGGGYVEMAKRYRDISKENGLFKTLDEKAKERPNVNLLKGAPVIWGSADAWEYVQESRAEGILRGNISNAHHGLRDISTIRQIQDLGYICNEYDSYSDIMEGGIGQQRDNVEEVAIRGKNSDKPKTGWLTDTGTQFYDRSSAFAMRAWLSYVPDALNKYGYNGRFIDVSMAMLLHEDWHPEHTFDKRQDLAYRREAYTWLQDSMGLVTGTEYGNDWGIDLVDYFEGSLSGSTWWDSVGGSWNAGQLRSATSKDDYTPQYMKYGVDMTNRIPLFQLVYHDVAVSTWYWGDCPGFHYKAWPKLSDMKDVNCILYGSTNLAWRDNIGFGWDINRERFVKSLHLASHYHKAVAFSEMQSHEFLSEDKQLQRTRFDNGAVAVANFSDEPREYTDDDGNTVILAPIGFMAKAPGITQSRLMVDDQVVTQIDSDEVHYYVSPEGFDFAMGTVKGTAVAFTADKNETWQMALSEKTSVKFDVYAMTGWGKETRYDLFELDSLGREKQVLTAGSQSSVLSLRSVTKRRYFAIKPSEKTSRVVIYPPSGYLGTDQNVVLSTTEVGADIYYTVDGSVPTKKSSKYSSPFAIEKGVSVKAAAFSSVKAETPVYKSSYDLIVDLFESGIMTGADSAKHVKVSLEGFDRLRLLVGNGGDNVWSDHASFGSAAFIKRDGEKVYLSDLEPLYKTQVHGTFSEDRVISDIKFRNPPITIKGREFKKGISTRADAELIYALNPEYMSFEAYVGVDDSNGGGPAGTIEFTIQGVKDR